jgi:hypothetical protein
MNYNLTNQEKIKARFKSMTAEQKLELSLELYYSAKELKRSWLRMQHKDWTDKQVEDKLREIFLYART